MGTNYPSGFDDFLIPNSSTKVNDTYSHAEAHRDLVLALQAIQATLGVNPQGNARTVSERISNIITTGGLSESLDASVVNFTPFGSIGANNIQSAIIEAVADAAEALDNHVSETNSVHGIPDTNLLILSTDIATSSTAGVVVLADGTETSSGISASKAITPDALSSSIFGIKEITETVFTAGTSVTTGDGKLYFRIPPNLNNMVLVSVGAAVFARSTSGNPTIQIARGRQSSPTSAHSFVDMLSTRITIDANDYDSKDAAAQPVIDESNAHVVTGDLIRVDVDVAGTGTTGLFITFGFQLSKTRIIGQAIDINMAQAIAPIISGSGPVALDLFTVRSQEFGYAEENGITGGIEGTPVVVTSTADSGAGSLRTALSSSNRYITFDPSIYNGTITLSSTLETSANNITIDGVGANISVTGATTRFLGDNIVIAGMTFKNAGGINNDCITLRRDDNPTTPQRVLVSFCTLTNEADPANTDTCIDIIWRHGEDTIVTLVGTFLGRSKRGSLIHAGDSTAPGGNEERGWYYITFAYCHWFRCFERHPFAREGHVHIYNNYVQRYGGAASSGSGARMGDDDASPPLTNWMLAENCVVLPLDVGETDYLGVVASNPQEKWFGPSASNNGTPNMRADGTYLKTNGSTTPTEEEIDTSAVGAPPYTYPLATANDALQTFINTVAGHPAAIRSTLSTKWVNPATGIALLKSNQTMVVHTEDPGNAITGVELVIGGGAGIPMTESPANVWTANVGSLTVNTSTTIKAVATHSGGPTESPEYPAFIIP